MRSILIVDDSADTRAFCGWLAKIFSLRVKNAKNVDEAMALLDGGLRPEAVLLDLMMAGRKPAELVERIRADERLAKTKIVIMSAIREVKAEATKMGVERAVRKPFNMPEFADALGLRKLA